MVSLPLDLWDWSLTLGGWQPQDLQKHLFCSLYAHLLAGNQRLNLTRITAPVDFWEKHLWDSLVGIVPWLPQDERSQAASEFKPELCSWALPDPLCVIDIGTGGGFPGLPVAIVRPDWQVSLLDSTRKKMVFLESLVQRLGLPNVRLRCDRAETLGQSPQFRQTFDLALIRAVGSARCCAEYSLPLLKVGGIAVLYRGEWHPEDTLALDSALRLLGGELLQVQAVTTPLTQSQRHLVYLRKAEPTRLDYPRPVGVPARHPLGTGA
ncbi:16S rRNA (guanine(527)-N(7))-methyltransferase RsmG [Synechococcales cyanobacterium C]|uniref:Ribosomal RNA small subunit methyltransferase G n=1 Tax=Petrachloros mirabilis ULC683 TaxID=2781853 RepID=A0A8K2A8N7_9CYAN|nr:16S rRNA (guanine(527)-N(7))-methyltransferase RsmG [Petrachloros mirabilis ULC683]